MNGIMKVNGNPSVGRADSSPCTREPIRPPQSAELTAPPIQGQPLKVDVHPDWKREYLKLSEQFLKQRKELEDVRGIGMDILNELERVLARLNAVQNAAAHMVGATKDVDERDYAEYIAYLEDENREMKEQLQAQRYQIELLQKERRHGHEE